MTVKPLAEFIVVTYRSSATARRELLSHLRCAGVTDEATWTFVDNGEEGEDARFLCEHGARYDNVRILARPKNPGFAASCNLAALRSRAQWVVFINPDIMFPLAIYKDFLQFLRNLPPTVDAVAMSQETKGLVHRGITLNRGGWFLDRVVYSDPNSGGRSSWGSFRCAGGAGALIGPSGGAGAYRTGVFKQSGGFCEGMFAWGEDAELALRLNLSGKRCAEYVRVLRHIGGHSVSGPAVRKKRDYWLARNRVLLASRLYSLPQLAAFFLYLVLVTCVLAPHRLAAGTFMANLRGTASGVAAGPRARRAYEGPRFNLRRASR